MGQTTFSGPVKSDNGFIENSFTTAERDALTPVTGLLIYNTTENVYQVYNGTAWVSAFAAPTVTYTAGVDYTLGSNLQFASGNTLSMSGSWTNTTAYNTVKAQPSGTVYTATAAGSSGTITLTGTWGGGGGYDFVSATGTGVFSGVEIYQITSITFSPSPLPFVGGISPNYGTVDGGTSVTITGGNFTGATAVTIGGTAVTSFTVVDTNTITAVTAAHVAGQGTVLVTNASGTSAGGTVFNYEAASVTYTAGVDYVSGANLRWDGTGFQITISGAPWLNLAAYSNVIAQPSGTVYTCVVNGVGTGTITTTGAWAGGGGLDFANATGTGPFNMGGASWAIDSITFTPA